MKNPQQTRRRCYKIIINRQCFQMAYSGSIDGRSFCRTGLNSWESLRYVGLSCSSMELNLNKTQPTRFYHIRSLPTSDTDVAFVCDCPNRSSDGCIHISLFKTHATRILQMEPFSPSPHPPAFLITHSSTLGGFVFSVCSTSGTGLQGGKRTIVSLSGDGWWSCRSCPSKG